MADEEKKPYDGPAELPDYPEAEVKQIAVDLFHGKIYCDRHLHSPDDMPRVFMIVGLGAFADHPKSYIESIGLVYEYLDKAMPRGINGQPMFMSLKLLNRSDTNKMFEIYNKLKTAEEEALK